MRNTYFRYKYDVLPKGMSQKRTCHGFQSNHPTAIKTSIAFSHVDVLVCSTLPHSIVYHSNASTVSTVFHFQESILSVEPWLKVKYYLDVFNKEETNVRTVTTSHC